MRVSVVDEAQAIGRVLADLPSVLVTRVVVVGSVSRQIAARAELVELSTGFTEPFCEIDVVNDLIRLARELRLAPAKAPRTAAWLGEWEQAVAHLRQGLGEL